MDHTAKSRNEIDRNMTWDLSRLYADDAQWEKDFAEIDDGVKAFLKFKGRLAESPETLLAAFQADDELGLVLERLYVYAHLKADEDTGNSANRARLDRISAKHAEIGGECAWFQPELIAMDEKVFEHYCNSPVLAFYKRTLDEIGKERKHTLSAAEERILSMSSDVLGTPYKTFSLLNDADLRFGEITGEDGVKTKLTHGNYIKFLESPKREVRKAAFEATYDTYARFKNTFSSLLDANFKTSALSAELHKFPSALEASLFEDNVPLSVYNGLIDTVHENMGSIHKYFRLRAEKLGLETLDMYDIHTPLLPECKMEVEWKDAVRYVKDSLTVLGEEYHSAIDNAFEQRWIDIPECRGKRSGAYSSGCYGKPPYILLNYSGTLDSVFTLAHELGHSMHSYFSDRSQAFHYASYKIFVAEVASTTNELLLHHHLMENAPDDSIRAYLLNHLADEVRGTVFRQTMFAEFERDMSALSEAGTPLTADLLSEKYFALNARYHGDAVRPDDRIRWEWARIPHFYYDFYVYKYATGFSAAVALSKKILAGEIEPYMGFLKAGDSKDVLDIMKDAGVDFYTGKPVEACMRFFDGTVDRLAEIMK